MYKRGSVVSPRQRSKPNDFIWNGSHKEGEGLDTLGQKISALE